MKNILISSVGAVIVFIAAYIIGYQSLLARQPQNGILPENFTSFPPSSAWVGALIYAVVSFVIIFVIGWIIGKIKNK